MVLNDDQDHASFWAHDEDMKRKTGEYRHKAKQLALDGKIIPPNLDPPFTDQPTHPWLEGLHRSDWKLEIFELEGDHHSVPGGSLRFTGTNVRELQEYWRRTRGESSTETKFRRVIVLENLDPRIAELLGVELDIPPEFFLAHCDWFTDLNVVDGSYRKQASSTYWKVPIPCKRSYHEDFDWSDVQPTIISGTLHRAGRVRWSGPYGTASYNSFMSYWGRTHEGGSGSWTALLLVDPPGSHIRHDYTMHVIELCAWEPQGRDLCHEVMLGSPDKKSQLYARSLYDALVEAHRHSQPAYTSDPVSATVFARNLIHAAWEANLIRDEWDVVDVLKTDQWRHVDYLIPIELRHSEIRQRGYVVTEFQGLIQTRQNITVQRGDLRSIIWKFQCDDITLGFLARESQEFPSRLEECRQWRILEEKARAMEANLGDHMEMFSQRAAMEEAYSATWQTFEAKGQTREANRMARSSGQLTKIATIIVPCSFVASIFSMGGDFAAGERRFYLYWVVSVPITVALLTWVLYKEPWVKSWTSELGNWVTSRRGELGDWVTSRRSWVRNPVPPPPPPPQLELVRVRRSRTSFAGGSVDHVV